MLHSSKSSFSVDNCNVNVRALTARNASILVVWAQQNQGLEVDCAQKHLRIWVRVGCHETESFHDDQPEGSAQREILSFLDVHESIEHHSLD